MKQIVSGTYKPGNGDYDGMHSFQSRKSDGFGGKMNDKVNEALKQYYKTNQKNPYVSSLKVTMDDSKFVVNWEVTIEESPDGKAYIGITSRGGAGSSSGSGGSIARAWSQISSKKKDLPSEISSKTEITNIADYNFKAKVKGWSIRQIFCQYTNPDSYPYLPKSAGYPTAIVGVDVGPTPKSLDNNSQVLSSSSIGPSSGPGTAFSEASSTPGAAGTTGSTTQAVGSIDGTSTTTGGKFDFVQLKECFISVPPRKGGSVPIFIFYPKNEFLETEKEVQNKQFSFSLGSEIITGTFSGIKMANRVVGFDNSLFKLNNNSIDEQIRNEKESPVKEWFNKYVMVFANNPNSDFNKLIQEVITDIEPRALKPSSFNISLYGESADVNNPVMKELPNITNRIKTLVLMEPIPSSQLLSISNSVKSGGGKVYYTYNPKLFTINMNDIVLEGYSGTYSFITGQISSTNSAMFPGQPIYGFTPSLINNTTLVASGLTTSFWQIDLPNSIKKVGNNYEIKYGGNTITKTILATGPGGSESHLLPFLPGGLYDGFSPRGLIYSNGVVVNKGPKVTDNLGEFRGYFSKLYYDSKDWITPVVGSVSGTVSSSASTPSLSLGITFSFTHNGLGNNLLPFTYTSLSDDLLKSGSYVYNLSQTAEFNRDRAGGTASGWPSLILEVPSIITSSGSTPSGQTVSGQTVSVTQSWTIRYLDSTNESTLNDINLNPQVTLQIFSYDIEKEIGKSTSPSKLAEEIPKIRGQFIFDVRYKGVLINDQLGEFKIVQKVEIDPYVQSEPDNLSGLDPSYLEEGFAGEEESLDDDVPSDDLKTFLGELYTEEDRKAEQQAQQSAQQSTSSQGGVPLPTGPEQTIQIEGKIQVTRADADIFWSQLESYNGKKEQGNNAGDPVERFLKDVGLGKGYPWCMAFVYSMFKEFTSKKGLKNPLPKTAACKTFWAEAKSTDKILASTAAANPSLIKGGQVFIKSRDGGGHTGIVLKADGPDHFLSIDGNSGDKVRLNRYKTSSMVGFVDFFTNPYFQDRVSELATPLLTSSKIEKGGGKET